MSTDLIAPGEISALLGRGTEFRGTLTFEGRVRLDGRFEGKIFSGGTLIVGEGAEVRADIEVGTLIALGGEVWGAVLARDLVELHAGATIHGDIETPKLFIDKGAVFDGRCSMGDGGEPERHPLSEEALLLDELASAETSAEFDAITVDGISSGDSAEDTTPGVVLDDAVRGRIPSDDEDDLGLLKADSSGTADFAPTDPSDAESQSVERQNE